MLRHFFGQTESDLQVTGERQFRQLSNLQHYNVEKYGRDVQLSLIMLNANIRTNKW